MQSHGTAWTQSAAAGELVGKPKLCLLHPKNEKIYNPDTSVNTVIKPPLCANKHSYHILIINEILTMVKKLFEEKCKHNGENYK